MAERPSDIESHIWQSALDWLFEIERHPHDAALRARLQAWLDADAAHGRAWNEARLIWTLSPQIAPSRPNEWHSSAARSLSETRAKRGSRRVLAGCIAAAAILALVMIGGHWPDLRADITSPVGEIRTATLDDGTRLHLDSDTALRISLEPGLRSVELLRGQAFFDVAPDSSRPFVVTAGPGHVAVVGTRFDARLDKETLRVAVEEGRVRAGFGPDETVLTGGQTLKVNFSARTLDLGLIEPEEIASWRSRHLVVDRWTVAQVLEELGHYRRGFIVLRDDSIAALPVSGVYDLRHPDDAVRAVAEAYGRTVTEITPFLLVVSRR
jgi:transmembrane sensor